MNLKYVGSVTLSLVVVACIALGVGYNASTLGSDGAKVDAAQEPPSTNATAQPETPPAQEAAQEPPSAPVKEVAQEEAASPTTEAKETRQDDDTKFQWPWKTILSLIVSGAACFFKDVRQGLYSLFIDCAVKRLTSYVMTIWRKTIEFLKHVRQDLSSLEIDKLSERAVELFVGATLAKCQTVRLQNGVLLFDGEPFYFDFPKETQPNKHVVDELVRRRLFIKKRGKDEYRVKKLRKKVFAELLKQDNLRIANTLPGAGRTILRALHDETDVARCEFASLTVFSCFVVENSEQNKYVGDMDFAHAVNRAIFMLRKNRLVQEWYVRSGPQTTVEEPLNLAFLQKFSFDSPSDAPFAFTGLEKQDLNFNPRNAGNDNGWVEGVAAPRGLEIASLLRAQPTFKGLSDAACELLVASLDNFDSPIYVKQGALYLGATYRREEHEFFSDLPEKDRPPVDVILQELLGNENDPNSQLLIKKNGAYLPSPIASDNRRALIERDNARIVKALGACGQKLFHNVNNFCQRIVCRLVADELSRYWLECRADQDTNTAYIHMPSQQEVKTLVDFMQKNSLVSSWSLAKQDKNGSITPVQVFPSHYPQNYVNEEYPVVVGNTTERGWRVACRLRGYRLPD